MLESLMAFLGLSDKELASRLADTTGKLGLANREIDGLREQVAYLENKLAETDKLLAEEIRVRRKDNLANGETIDKLNSTIRTREVEITELTLVVARNRQRVEEEIAVSAARSEVAQHVKMGGNSVNDIPGTVAR